MAGLQHCPQIQRLWLNGNKINTISHLENATCLRELWLQRNQLTECWGGLEACAQLEVLGVAGNPIRNLAGLQRLQSLPNLRALTLSELHFGSCPVASTEGYRHFVVAAVPQLTVVDERPVQAAEREGATKALLGLGDALAARVRSIHDEYDRADAELDTRLARHAREAAAVVGDCVAQLQALARTVQEGKAMMRADYQGQISAPQRAQQDYALALDIFERQVQRWGTARDEGTAPALAQAQQAAAQATHSAPWLCAVREALGDTSPLVPPSAPPRQAALAAAAKPTARALLPSGLAMDYSALRRADSNVSAASTAWVAECVHCVLQGAGGTKLGDGEVLHAPLPPAGVPAAYSGQWGALQAAQGGGETSSDAAPPPCVLFAHPSDAAAWGVAAGWACGGVLGVAQLSMSLSDDTPVVHSSNGGSALFTPAAASAALASTGAPLALVRLEVGTTAAAAPAGDGATPHWAALVSAAGGDVGVTFSLLSCLALHVSAADVAALRAAAQHTHAWTQQADTEAPHTSPGAASPTPRPVPPPGVFLAQASQMLDRAQAAYAAAAAGTGPPPPLTADEAAAEQRRAFARIMGTRRAIDSVRSAQETLLAQMTEGMQ